MRRLLRDVAEGRDPGDATTVSDPMIMDQVAQSLESTTRTVGGQGKIYRYIYCENAKKCDSFRTAFLEKVL